MKGVLFILVLSVLGGCQHSQSGFSPLDEGLAVRLLSFDDGQRRLSDFPLLELNYTVFDSAAEQLIYEGNQVFRNLKEDAIGNEAWFSDLMQRQIGDSLEYLVRCEILERGILLAGSDFHCDAQNYYRVVIALKRAWTVEEYESLFSSLHFSEPAEEFRFLKAQLTAVPERDSLIQRGELFMHWVERGKGPEISKNSLIQLHYRGFFINQKSFDWSPIDTGLIYQHGEQAQVLNGIEKAVSLCSFGDSVVVYMPSYLAFGSRGSTDGRVAPFSPLGYALRINKFEKSTLSDNLSY